MKIHPLGVFWTPYRGQKACIAKSPHHSEPPVNLPTFLVNFWASFDIFALLVNKCWPRFLCDKKAPIFPYTTLTSEFSYLVWFLRYLHFYVRIRLDPILKKLPSNGIFGESSYFLVAFVTKCHIKILEQFQGLLFMWVGFVLNLP